MTQPQAEIDYTATRGKRASNLHRIVVERNADGEVESVRFVCDGDDSAPCHWWPDCGCETWGPEHGTPGPASPSGKRESIALPGHEDVQQRICWIDPWFNDTTTTWSDFTELYDGPLDIDHPDVYGENADWLVSGPVLTSFEGDYMTWEYDVAAMVLPPGVSTGGGE